LTSRPPVSGKPVLKLQRFLRILHDSSGLSFCAKLQKKSSAI